MASAAIPERAVPAAGVKMPAVRGGMGNHSGAVTGEGKVLRINQPKADRRQYGKDGKDFLECGFRIVRGKLTVQNIVYDVPGGYCAGVFRLRQFSIGTALVNKNWTLKLYFFTYNLRLLYSRICFSVLFRCQVSE